MRGFLTFIQIAHGHAVFRSCFIKGDFRKFFNLSQISKNKCQITVLSTKAEETQWIDSAFISADLSESEKLSEVKPPLARA